METIFFPKFLKEFQQMEIFRRVEVFMNTCVKFTRERELGKDNSAEIMKTLAKHRPMTGVSALNCMFDLIKDVVFGYQTGIKQPDAGELLKSRKTVLEDKLKGTLGQLPSEMKLLSRPDRETLSKLYSDLKKSMSDHKTAVETLKTVQSVYERELDKLNASKAYFKDLYGAHAQTAYMYEHKKCIVARSEDKVRTVEIEVKKQTTRTAKAFGELQIAIEKEILIRNLRLKQHASDMQVLIEAKLRSAMTLGLYHLQEFGLAHNIQESIMDRLSYFDIGSAASEIYHQMSARYIYPVIESFTYYDEIPNSRLETPTISAQDKQQVRFGRSESCVSLLNENQWSNNNQEVHVWTTCSYRGDSNGSGLKFAKGQQIKQKLCSEDGSLAFGWKRPFPGGHKTYGFYDTKLTQLVP